LPKERDETTTITLDRDFAVKLKNEMLKLHNCKSFSEYVRGLMILDAAVFSAQLDIDLSNCPEWLLAAYPPQLIMAFIREKEALKRITPKPTLRDLMFPRKIKRLRIKM
jgi:hypothetical protein